MHVNSFSYVPGEAEGYKLPLQNFLPVLPKGTFPYWVKKAGISKHLLIDPISANPLLAVELAACGHRILSARSNPIIWMMTEVLASGPKETDFSTAVNKLLNMRHGNSTISDHLQDLYETPCSNCGKMIQPEGFVWEKGAEWPILKVYQCQYCGDEGEKEVSDFDRENIYRLGKLGIHRSRAFQKVAFGGTYEHASLNEALDCYLPRALYVCMLLTNILDRLSIEKKQSKIVRAVLLSIFNEAHSLKHWPIRNYRFLQLTVPQKFFEKNLFLAIQNVSQQWLHFNNPIEISYWPNLPPPRGGICFFQRGLAEKKQLIPENLDTSITTIFPRPGQAFWTLSAVWAGWLWGNKAVIPMRSALSRRRYDWFWFTKAVHVALNRISSSIHGNSICLGLLPEYTPNLAFGLFTGLFTAGYEMIGSAYRVSDAALQCQWKKVSSSAKPPQSEINLKNVVNQYLSARGEPTEYHHIIMHAIIEYVKKGGLTNKLSDISETDFSKMQNLIKQLLSKIDFLTPYSSELAGGSRWWLINEKYINPPISEKVEIAIRNILLSQKNIQKNKLDRVVCSMFPGFLTPEAGLINTILDTYTEPITAFNDGYRLNDSEYKFARDADLIEIINAIKSIGNSFNVHVSGNGPLFWTDKKSNKILYAFYPIVTAGISKFLFGHKQAEEVHKIIVFPGSRSSLIAYRLLHDPRLAIAVEERWHFLKFRSIRSLVKRGNLNLQSWEEIIDSDPPLKDPPNQLPII
jgi:hypothetical protein